ncbi:MAG: holo-ACP synthase [Chloroflexi bacterium]|nr:holo-ACP synthase [Chloroflexota bacterium]
MGDRPVVVPEGTVELGLDIIRVDRIRDAVGRFGSRFTARILTPDEAAYVRDRAETLAGRWAAKEAVSKVLGLGVRGVGWREIEIERLPTGQPAVRLHGRAAARAAQLGLGRVAVSISHEREYAVAIAFGVRTAGGRYVLPADIDDRLDEQETRLRARLERIRALRGEVAAATGLEPGVADSRPATEGGQPAPAAPRTTGAAAVGRTETPASGVGGGSDG